MKATENISALSAICAGLGNDCVARQERQVHQGRTLEEATPTFQIERMSVLLPTLLVLGGVCLHSAGPTLY